ncbi:glycosyltransferase [Chelativorans sp. M5D2P16]|uniref:glycosyltransferase n=1 Tax=Chelativorans sp. M5D2P16 TaxID=3095678 RepID=UPI002ACAA7DD|nr:glycosyltransferase [Chelativorans sp. M5D2P16]MDZ5699956.1 glycosyltransferase [Chelativorans sp. M5D2P16]
MRVAIDLQCCQSGSRLGGIGRYSLELAKAMIASSPDDEFLILLNNRYKDSIVSIRSEFSNLLPPSNFCVFDVPAGCSFSQGVPERLSTAEIIREEFVRQLNPDVLHIGSVIEGLDEEVVTSVKLIPTGIPTASTLYDLIPLVNQERYLSHEVAREHYMQRISYLERSDLLLAISQYSADEGRRLLKNFSGDIVNISGGIDNKFIYRNHSKYIFKDGINKFGIKSPYILYTASFDTRKNQDGLIKAFSMLPDNLRNSYQLVFVGNGWPEIYQKLQSAAIKAGLAADAIVFTGRVDDEELVELYRRCHLFVFPSFWEGLGLPLIEAMACGAPVIGSNTTSLPEFLPHPSAGFDPKSPEAIAEKMAEFLQDRDKLQWLREIGQQYATQFTWRASAEKAMRALRVLYKSRVTPFPLHDAVSTTGEANAFGKLKKINLSEDDLGEAVKCIVNNEAESDQDWLHADDMKIGWISSWKTRCGIASYSENLIEFFGKKPIILAPYAVDRFPSPEVDVIPCWHQGKDDDLSNLRLLVSDLDLDHIIIQFNYGFFDFESLSKLLDEQVRCGVSVSLVLHSTTDPTNAAPNDQLQTLLPSLAKVDAVFVHSLSDCLRLSDRGLSSNVHLLPQGVRLRDVKRPKRSSNRRRSIASYGFFLPGKGLPELIESMSFMLRDGRDFELLMVNANYGDIGGVSSGLISQCKEMICSLNLEDRVKVIDEYLEDEESLYHLSNSDIVVFPYQNTKESSSAAVRMGLASGVPVAVTPLPIFDDVKDAVHHLPGRTPEEIAVGVSTILDAIEREENETRMVAEAAERWRRSHDVSQISRHLEHRIRVMTFGRSDQ